MKIALVHANDGSDVRVGKTCRSLSALGHEVHFLGWDRRPLDSKDIDLGGATADLLRFETPFGRATVSGHARFLVHVLGCLRRLRPKVVCAVNEDAAALLLPFKGFFYQHLVCDVFDALADRHSDKGSFVRGAAGLVATAARRGADRLIATDVARFERFGPFRAKTTIIENFPEDPGPVLAATLPAGPVKIWAAGTLYRRRGLAQLLHAVSAVPEARIVSAGWAYDDFATDVFLRHPQVDFHGIVTADRALRLAAGCDAVFCYYEPASVNNRFASPNKVYDALAVGRPVIINSEVGLAAWVERERLGYSFPYEDRSRLIGGVRDLAQRRHTLAEDAQRLRAVFESRYTWQLMEKQLEELYGALA
jgi:glycosyltransferase involved in cell wall biosynthesis